MIGAIVQARMSSARLPQKILHRVNNKPMLQYLLESLFRCTELDKVVVATSSERLDDSLEAFCCEYGVAYHRGPLADVAGRFKEVIDIYRFDAFIRVSGDSPLLDYRLVDRAVKIFESGRYDLVTNITKRTFPRGQSVEVVDSTVFNATYPRMLKESEREHVTAFFYAHRENFTIHNFESGKDYGNVQLSVDTPADLMCFAEIVAKLEKPHWEYTYEDFVNIVADVEGTWK